MKKLTLILSAVLLCTSMLFAQKDIVEQDRKVQAFTKVDVSNGIDIYIEQGNATKLEVEASEKDIDDVITEVRDGVLYVHMKRSSFNTGKVNVYVETKNIEAIKASGGSDVVSKKGLKSDEFQISLSGGSDLKATIATKELSCKASGGSDIILKGKADMLDAVATGGSDIEIDNFEGKEVSFKLSGGSDVEIDGKATSLYVKATGGSDIDADKFVVKNARVEVHGGSDADIHVTENLNVEAHSSSDVKVSGKPDPVKMDKDDSSSISFR